MPLHNSGRNACLAGGLTAAITHIGIHSALPNTAGSNELAGGTYARVAALWDAPSSGLMANDGALAHNIPAGATAAFFGFWSALTGGTCHGYAPINGSIDGFGVVDAADVTANTITSNAHGLANDARVYVLPVNGEALPAGLVSGTLYYIVGQATNTFQVSATLGGAAVDITGAGELYFQQITPEVFASAGVLNTADAALVHDLTTL